jgi:hypothetical protein
VWSHDTATAVLVENSPEVPCSLKLLAVSKPVSHLPPAGVALPRLRSSRPQVQSVPQNAELSSAKLLMARCGVSALLVDTGPSGAGPGFVTKRDFLKVGEGVVPEQVSGGRVMVAVVVH